jgi:hypothetical protein
VVGFLGTHFFCWILESPLSPLPRLRFL